MNNHRHNGPSIRQRYSWPPSKMVSTGDGSRLQSLGQDTVSNYFSRRADRHLSLPSSESVQVFKYSSKITKKPGVVGWGERSEPQQSTSYEAPFVGVRPSPQPTRNSCTASLLGSDCTEALPPLALSITVLETAGWYAKHSFADMGSQAELGNHETGRTIPIAKRRCCRSGSALRRSWPGWRCTNGLRYAKCLRDARQL